MLCDVVYKYLRYKLTDIIFVEMVLIMKTGELSVLSDASRAFFSPPSQIDTPVLTVDRD